MEKYACSISNTFSEYELNTKINLIDLTKRIIAPQHLLHILKTFNVDMDLYQLENS